MLTIESRAGRHYATLSDDPEGVRVRIWRRARRVDKGSMAARIGEWLLDCPFHMACDRVYGIVYGLPDELVLLNRGND
jgi:hypothetical protein